ncbi:Uncharacterized protein HZ326_10282 [Fusarium oxysporum f. sp. albedinis]|nr:Uncharacterized protein HZ326_10282 [Fusarium oxysporum f. sp. albedinis]
MILGPDRPATQLVWDWPSATSQNYSRLISSRVNPTTSRDTRIFCPPPLQRLTTASVAFLTQNLPHSLGFLKLFRRKRREKTNWNEKIPSKLPIKHQPRHHHPLLTLAPDSILLRTRRNRAISGRIRSMVILSV